MLASVTCLLVVAPAVAQSDREDWQDVYPTAPKRSDIVVTATGSGQLPEETGQAITTLDRVTINRLQLPSVADLLATTPGVTISRNGGPGQPTAVRIRGAEDAQTLVLIDGVRANDPSAPAGAFDFGTLLTGNIARIEVLRGPNSVPWGSQALGGVVNIVTASDNGAELRAEYGENDAANVSGRVGHSLGPVRVSLGGQWLRDDGVSAYRFGTERDRFRQYAGSGRVQVELSDAVNLDLRGNYANSRVGFDGFPPPTFAFADTDAFSEAEQTFGYAGINARIGPVTNRLGFALSDTRRRSFASAAATPSRFNGRTERFEYQGDARITDRLRAVFGGEHETSRFNNAVNARRSTGVTSGYAQLILDATDRLTLTGGARVDRHRDYGTEATFSANAAWRVGNGTIMRIAYGEGFKAPTLFQLFDPSFGNVNAAGTTDLEPEKGRSFEAGIEQSLLGARLRVGLTAFQRDNTNEILFGSPVPRTDRRFGYYFNGGRTRTRGIETFIALRPSDKLTLTANYSLIDARNRVTGLRLMRRPVHSINASVDWAGPVRLGADIRTTSDSVDNDFRTFARTSLDGYTLVTLRAALPIGERLELYGRVENLFGESYETVSGYGTYGRNAHVGVRVRL